MQNCPGGKSYSYLGSFDDTTNSWQQAQSVLFLSVPASDTFFYYLLIIIATLPNAKAPDLYCSGIFLSALAINNFLKLICNLLISLIAQQKQRFAHYCCYSCLHLQLITIVQNLDVPRLTALRKGMLHLH